MARKVEPGSEPAAGQRVPFHRYFRYFLGLGTWGFGGPIATVGYMQRDLVEGRDWVSRRDFLDGVALGQTMPGPLAAQVAMWVGYLQAGAVGALGTAIPFILPSLAIVLGVAYLYVRFQGLTVVQSLFYGIAPAVMAIIAFAAVKLARLTNSKDIRLWVISAAIMAVTALTGAEIAILFVAAGLVMLMWDAPPRFLKRGGATSPLLVAVPFSVLTGTATAGTLVALGLFFLKAGAFSFGSGLAIVPITPGPVVITAAFIGYLVGGMAGAGIATLAIFTPIYLGVVVPGRWFIRHRDNLQIRAFVKGATAAAAGAIGGATIVLTRQAVVDLPTAGILAASLVFVWRLKNKEPILVLLAGAAGLLMKGL